MKFIKLTSCFFDRTQWVNMEAVLSFYPDKDRNCTTILGTYGEAQIDVKETPKEIMAKLLED